MKTFAAAVVLISATLLFSAKPVHIVSPFYQAFCNDGDGPLSEWLSSRYEAYLIGRDHELLARGHRWDILVQTGATVVREPVCGRITESTKPGILRLENTCDKCTRFTVSRTTEDGNVKAREIKIDAKKSRHFRKLPNATVRVEGERDCTE